MLCGEAEAVTALQTICRPQIGRRRFPQKTGMTGRRCFPTRAHTRVRPYTVRKNAESGFIVRDRQGENVFRLYRIIL